MRDTPATNATQTRTLKVLQYNVHKSLTNVMTHLLRDPATHEFDIIAVQEPWRNPFRAGTHNPSADKFHLVYAPGDDVTQNVCMFVSTRIDKATWSPEFHSPNCMTLHLTGANGKLTHVHNIYNPPPKLDQLQPLAEAIGEYEGDEHLVIGDFNLHHPLWTGPGRHQHREARALVEIIDRAGLSLLTPEGLETFKSKKLRTARRGHTLETTIDLAFGTSGLTDRLISCDRAEHLDQQGDHWPIATVIDFMPVKAVPRKYFDIKNMDVEGFTKQLTATLPQIDTNLLTADAIDEATDDFIETLKRATESNAPTKTISPFSVPGLTPECAQAIKKCRQAHRKYNKTHSPRDWKRFTKLRNYKTHLTKTTMRNNWREYAGKIGTGADLWNINRRCKNKYAPDPHSRPLYETQLRASW